MAANTVAKQPRTRVGKNGGTTHFTEREDFKSFGNYAARYAKKRKAELQRAFRNQPVSLGVSAIVDSEAAALAAARYLEAAAKSTGDPDLFRQAVSMGTVARQHALAAWELAARECVVSAKEPQQHRIIIQMPSVDGSEPTEEVITPTLPDRQRPKSGKTRTTH